MAEGIRVLGRGDWNWGLWVEIGFGCGDGMVGGEREKERVLDLGLGLGLGLGLDGLRLSVKRDGLGERRVDMGASLELGDLERERERDE